MIMRPENTVREHVLLTVLGTNPRSALYALDDRKCQAMFAPVALLRLLPEASRPSRLFAVCTPEAASETWPSLEEELECSSETCEPERIDVPSGSDQADIDNFLDCVTRAIPENTELTVDVTHGFRHYSFLTCVAVQYLTTLHNVQVHGAYYGSLGHSPDDTSPFLDLRPLLELPRWTHALEVLRDTGSALPMAEAIRGKPLKDKASSGQHLRRQLADGLAHFSEGYLSGLPLELGRQSQIFRSQRLRPLKRLLKRTHSLPLTDDLVGQLDKILASFALTKQLADNGWKRCVGLSEEELKRQAGMIDSLLEHGHIAAGLGLMNEWTVSWAVLRRQREACDWLDYWNVRKKAAGALNAIVAIRDDSKLYHILTDEQRALGDFWSDLKILRNGYHHHGMRHQPLVGDGQTKMQLSKVERYWHTTLRLCPDFSLSLGESMGRLVLVSPVGMRRGVLFSALDACRTAEGEPDLCLAICSGETEGLIADAINGAKFTGVVQPLVLEDPFGGGRHEIERLANWARQQFVGADKVLVNVTGGTTLMGLAVEELANVARSLASPVRRFGLIDHRPPAQRDADPYQVGEPFWLDK